MAGETSTKICAGSGKRPRFSPTRPRQAPFACIRTSLRFPAGAGWHALSLRRACGIVLHALRRLRACHPSTSPLLRSYFVSPRRSQLSDRSWLLVALLPRVLDRVEVAHVPGLAGLDGDLVLAGPEQPLAFARLDRVLE